MALPVIGSAWCLFCIVGRGLDPAAPIIFQILKIIMCGGRNRPPYKPGETVGFSANPARPFTPAGRHICRPYKHPVSRTRTRKRYLVANGHGPHTCGPYKPAGNDRQMGKAGVCRKRPRRGQDPALQTPRGAHPCREAYMPPLQIRVTAHTNQKRCLTIPFLVATAFGLCVGAAYMPPAKRCGNRALPPPGCRFWG